MKERQKDSLNHVEKKNGSDECARRSIARYVIIILVRTFFSRISVLCSVGIESVLERLDFLWLLILPCGSFEGIVGGRNGFSAHNILINLCESLNFKVFRYWTSNADTMVLVWINREREGPLNSHHDNEMGNELTIEVLLGFVSFFSLSVALLRNYAFRQLHKFQSWNGEKFWKNFPIRENIMARPKTNNLILHCINFELSFPIFDSFMLVKQQKIFFIERS